MSGHTIQTEHFSVQECVIAAQYLRTPFITCDGRAVPRGDVWQVALDADDTRIDYARMPSISGCLTELRVTARAHSVWCLTRVRFDGQTITDSE